MRLATGPIGMSRLTQPKNFSGSRSTHDARRPASDWVRCACDQRHASRLAVPGRSPKFASERPGSRSFYHACITAQLEDAVKHLPAHPAGVPRPKP